MQWKLSWYILSKEDSTPCNTVSERSPSRALWGWTSPNQPLFTRTQTSPSWPRLGLQDFQRSNWPKAVWFLPWTGLRGQTYRILQGPNRLRRRSSTLSVCVVKHWKRLLAFLVTSPLVSIFKKSSRTVSGSKIFLKHPCNFCCPSPIFHSVFIVTQEYLCFLFPWTT